MKNTLIQWISSRMQLVNYRNKPRVIRVYENNNQVPEKILTEVEHNKFKDEAENKVYTLNPMTRVIVGV